MLRSSSSRFYAPAWWTPGPHLQTLWGKLFRRQPLVPTRLERWDTPDGDFLDIHRIEGAGIGPSMRVVLLHGLEGTVRSHYIQGILGEIQRRGWAADLVIWRSCGVEPNRARRFYHSGETGDLAFVLQRLIREHPRDLLTIVGVSLGGNVLLKYLGERGTKVPRQLVGAAAISVPFDLAQSAACINRGFSRVYQRYFLDSLLRKTREKLARYPDLIAPERLDSIRTLADFDDALTAPVHGFASGADYYARSSSLGYLAAISTDTLLLNASNDPFLPRDVLGEVRRIARRNPKLHLELPASGGHAGFVGGRNPLRPIYYLDRRVGEFLAERFALAPQHPRGSF